MRRIFTARRVLLVSLAGTVALFLWDASPIVIMWMVMAELGLYFAYLNGIESLADYQALGGKQNGRRTIAIGNMRREIVRGLVAFDFIAIGVMVLLGTSGVVAPGLLLASAGMVMNSYLDRRDRLYLLENGLQARDAHGKFTT